MKNTYTHFIAAFMAVIVFTVNTLYASPPKEGKPVNAPSQKAPLSFVENVGQVTDQNNNRRTDIQYKIAAANGLNIFIGNGAIHYQFSKCDNPQLGTQNNQIPNSNPDSYRDKTPNPKQYTMYRMDVELIGANKNANVVTEGKLDYYENYFTNWSGGKDVAVHAYSRIIYKDVYPNIDWVIYISSSSGRPGGVLKYEFLVKKGGKVSDIKLKYGGATDLKINANKDLIATTPQGVITENAPNTYGKDGKKINSRFKLDGDVLSYATDSYTGDIIIDPTLIWATYYGGFYTDEGEGVATDASGNVYVTGETESTSSIATAGAYQTVLSGNYDAFLAKFNSSGTLQWATYYGGTSADNGTGVATDASGNVYIIGTTASASGIATASTYQTVLGGTQDAFLAKFNSSGAIQWATYYGGTNDESGYGIATDGSGNVYITGLTESASGIVTAGAYQTVLAGTDDAFLAKFNSSGAIQWATYYGGTSYNYGNAVTIDVSGNVYMTGTTESTSGIATAGAYQTVYGGGSEDAFLAKFNSSGAIQWATYYAGTYGNATGVATDASGNVYITGLTNSATGIATTGAYQTVYAGFGGAPEVFLAKFNSSGAIQWATYYGGTSNNYGYGVATDDSGNVYITGQTESASGIATAGAYQTVLTGTDDAFLAKFNSSGTIRWATYYGGPSADGANGIATDAFANVYITGVTQSASGIATSGAHQTAYGGMGDAFLAKFNFIDPITGAAYVCAGSGITLSDAITGGAWSSSNTAIATIDASGDVSGITSGTVTISYAAGGGVATTTFTVNPLPVAGVISGTLTVCPTANITLSDGAAGGVWSSVTTSIATIGASTGVVNGVTAGPSVISYTVTNICGVATATIMVTVDPSPVAGVITGTLTVCPTATITLSDDAAGGVWSSSNTGIATVSASGDVSGVAGGSANITYAVTNSCGTATAYSGVTVNPLPSAGTISGITLVCLGLTTTLSDGVGSGTWSSSNTGIATVDASGVVYGVATGTVDITYSVTNGCGTTTTYSGVTVSAVATAGTISGPTTVCAGATALLSDGIGGGVWSSDNISSATVDASGTVYGVAAGTSNITYMVTSSCGTATTATTITVNPLPVAGVVSGLSSVCIGASISLTDGTAGGNWSSDNTTIATVNSTGTVDGISAGSATISYSVTNSCGVTAATEMITVNSCTTGIQNVPGQTAVITIFPNPATNELTITYTANITSISINNLVGQTLYAHDYNASQVQIDVSGLPAGIYLVRVNNTEVRKFIKQ